MKKQWTRLLARLNIMTVRERLLLVTGVVALLSALTDFIFIEPLYKKQKLLAEQIDRESGVKAVQRERLQFELMKRGRENAAELNISLRNVQSDIDTVEKEISTLSGSNNDLLTQPAMLARVLKRTDKVSLVRVASAGAENSVAASPGAVGAPRAGLDITLAGSYLDLMDYLASLEKAIPQARWSGITLSTASTPPQVTVRIAAAGGS